MLKSPDASSLSPSARQLAAHSPEQFPRESVQAKTGAPGTIYDALMRAGLERCGTRTVLDCAINAKCLGLRTSGGTGLAFVPREAWEAAERQGVARVEAGLLGRPLAEIVPRYAENDPLRTVIALAAINALLVHTGKDDPGTWHRDLGHITRLGLVGDLRPFVSRIGLAGHEQVIFELRSLPGTHPPEAAPDLLPGCDVVIITSAVFSNKTLHHYLPHIAPRARAFIFGHSTPLADCLLGTFALGSNEVTDAAGALQSLREGNGIRDLKPFMRKVIREKMP